MVSAHYYSVFYCLHNYSNHARSLFCFTTHSNAQIIALKLVINSGHETADNTTPENSGALNCSTKRSRVVYQADGEGWGSRLMDPLEPHARVDKFSLHKHQRREQKKFLKWNVRQAACDAIELHISRHLSRESGKFMRNTIAESNKFHWKSNEWRCSTSGQCRESDNDVKCENAVNCDEAWTLNFNFVDASRCLLRVTSCELNRTCSWPGNSRFYATSFN